MSNPSTFKLLRRHEKPLSNYKVVYEVYDPQNHAIYLCWLSPHWIIDGFTLKPTETLSEYLRTTSGTYIYPPVSEKKLEQAYEHFYEEVILPARHICDSTYECEDSDCRFCAELDSLDTR